MPVGAARSARAPSRSRCCCGWVGCPRPPPARSRGPSRCWASARTPAAVAALTDRPPARSQTRSTLAAAEILRPEAPLGFVHPLVHDAVYRELPAAQRELAHAGASALREAVRRRDGRHPAPARAAARGPAWVVEGSRRGAGRRWGAAPPTARSPTCSARRRAAARPSACGAALKLGAPRSPRAWRGRRRALAEAYAALTDPGTPGRRRADPGPHVLFRAPGRGIRSPGRPWRSCPTTQADLDLALRRCDRGGVLRRRRPVDPGRAGAVTGGAPAAPGAPPLAAIRHWPSPSCTGRRGGGAGPRVAGGRRDAAIDRGTFTVLLAIVLAIHEPASAEPESRRLGALSTGAGRCSTRRGARWAAFRSAAAGRPGEAGGPQRAGDKTRRCSAARQHAHGVLIPRSWRSRGASRGPCRASAALIAGRRPYGPVRRRAVVDDQPRRAAAGRRRDGAGRRGRRARWPSGAGKGRPPVYRHRGAPCSRAQRRRRAIRTPRHASRAKSWRSLAARAAPWVDGALPASARRADRWRPARCGKRRRCWTARPRPGWSGPKRTRPWGTGQLALETGPCVRSRRARRTPRLTLRPSVAAVFVVVERHVAGHAAPRLLPERCRATRRRR